MGVVPAVTPFALAVNDGDFHGEDAFDLAPEDFDAEEEEERCYLDDEADAEAAL